MTPSASNSANGGPLDQLLAELEKVKGSYRITGADIGRPDIEGIIARGSAHDLRQPQVSKEDMKRILWNQNARNNGGVLTHYDGKGNPVYGIPLPKGYRQSIQNKPHASDATQKTQPKTSKPKTNLSALDRLHAKTDSPAIKEAADLAVGDGDRDEARAKFMVDAKAKANSDAGQTNQSPQGAYFPNGTFSSPESLAEFTGAPPTRGKYDTRSVRSGQPLGAYDGSAKKNGIGNVGVYNRMPMPKGIQTKPLKSVPEGAIREPLFGRNPNGSPKPRPPGITSEEVAALSATQERKYNSTQKATKKTTNSTNAKATTPPGVIGYDALNQPVYGRKAPSAKQDLSATYRDSPLDKLDSLTQARDIYGNEIKVLDLLSGGGVNLQQNQRAETTKKDFGGLQFRNVGGQLQIVGKTQQPGITDTEATSSMGQTQPPRPSIAAQPRKGMR